MLGGRWWALVHDRGEVWNRWFLRLPWWAHTVLVALLLGSSWLTVHTAGGTRTAWPHVFYVPIVVAALPFGVRGGLIAGALAALLCGPVMPLDVATGESQQLVNWLIRGGFFVVVGGVAGASTGSLRSGFAAGLREQLEAELTLVTASGRDLPEEGWELRVRQVLDRDAFHPVFQPIFRLDGGELLAVEALTRFDTDPVHPPNEWFTNAAAVGLGVELELATAKMAMEAAGELPTSVALTINASPAALTDVRLLHLLDWHRDRRVIVEVTEHAIVEDYQQLTEVLGELRARGVEVAVDDAGAGFASFRHIVRLRPEYIKLDLSLTQDLRNDPVRRPLAEALLRFAQQTGSCIIAEGIETSSDLATWRDLGAHAAQGYLLGRPVPTLPGPVDAFPARLRSHVR